MYTEYSNELSEEDLIYERSRRPSDIQLPPIVNTLFLVTWSIIFLVGLGVIYRFKNPMAGGLIIGIPTFIGMVIKPTFALSIMMLALPTGAGVGFKQVFSLERGVGIALAVSFLLNLMISRPQLRIRNKALWALVLYSIWIFFASFSETYIKSGARRGFTQFQLLALVLIVYWIIETNGEKTFRWALRAYVIGTLGMVSLTYITGTAIQSMEETGEERYTATLGWAIDANMLSALISMAFLAAIYLFARDKNLIWKLVHLATVISMPIMMLKIASRGGLIALAFTLSSPLLFLRQVLRKPVLAALLLLVIILASASAAFFISKRSLEGRVESRLTDIEYAKKSLSDRIGLMKTAIESARTRPLGTGHTAWFELTGAIHHPHSDFFFALGLYGIPAAALFTLFVIMMMLTVKRMPLGLEKLYARAVLTFLLIMGMNITQIFQKHYWVFLAFVIASERLSNLAAEQKQLTREVTEEEIVTADFQ